MPPAPKCLTRSRFLPDDPSYQDVQQKPLLLTLAYAWALQYWVEEVCLPTLGDYCPLAMSVVELKWWVERHVTFSKQDIFRDLGSAIPEARSRDMEIPQVDSFAPPTTKDVGAMEPSPMETQGADDTISLLPGCQPKTKTEDRQTPPADSTTSQALADAKDTQPGSTETPPGDDTTVPLAKPDTKTPKDLLTAQASSPVKAKSQVAPTTRSVDKVADPHPIWPCRRGKTVCVDCDRLHGEAEFGGHWGYPHGHSDCLSQESGLQEPPHGGHPPRTPCRGYHRPPLRS